MVQRIAQHFRPWRIILFGSYAHGETTPDSDVDLLVVMDSPLRDVDQAVEVRRLADFPFPTDLLVRKPHEVRDRLAQGDAFLEEVLTRGVVLYEAPDPGVD